MHRSEHVLSSSTEMLTLMHEKKLKVLLFDSQLKDDTIFELL
jgi:hypothetical protein